MELHKDIIALGDLTPAEGQQLYRDIIKHKMKPEDAALGIQYNRALTARIKLPDPHPDTVKALAAIAKMEKEAKSQIEVSEKALADGLADAARALAAAQAEADRRAAEYDAFTADQKERYEKEHAARKSIQAEYDRMQGALRATEGERDGYGAALQKEQADHALTKEKLSVASIALQELWAKRATK